MKSRHVIPLFTAAHFSHHLSTGVLVPLLPLLRQDFELDYFQLGVLVSSFSLSYGFGLPSFSLVGPLLFAATRAPAGIWLLLSLAAYGTSISARMPAMESLIADVVPPDDGPLCWAYIISWGKRPRA
jgi:predicted MFS family arabinose efflux permease